MQPRRADRALGPIPDPRLDAEALAGAGRYEPLTSNPFGSMRSAHRFEGDEIASPGDAGTPSPSDQWFVSGESESPAATASLNVARLVAMFEASRQVRVAATILMAILVLALLFVFLKVFTTVL